MTNRFEKISDTEIRDDKTRLVWRSDYKEDLTWQEAMDYAESLGEPWRLPTNEELLTLIDFGRIAPASDFPGMPSSYFWSASPYIPRPAYAWYVYFDYGGVYYASRTSTHSARCVRDSEEK